jgi:Derlin-2/3
MLTLGKLTAGFYLGALLLLSPLTLALAYTYAQENPNRQVSYFIVTFSSKYLPYAMLAMTFVMASPQQALIQSTGLVAAHAYDFLAKIWPEYGGGRQLISTPQFVRNWFQSPGGTPIQRGAGTAYSARTTGSQTQQSGQGGGAGGLTNRLGGAAWGTRGPGRRLGGD